MRTTHNDKEDGFSSGHSLSPHDAVSVKLTSRIAGLEKAGFPNNRKLTPWFLRRRRPAGARPFSWPRRGKQAPAGMKVIGNKWQYSGPACRRPNGQSEAAASCSIGRGVAKPAVLPGDDD